MKDANSRLDSSLAPPLRNLKGETDTSHSPGFIAWYCFLSVFFTVLVLTCLAYFGYVQWRRRRRIQRTQEQQRVDREISRIEANVKFFSEQQEYRRRKCFQRATRRQTVIVTEQDLLSRKEDQEGSDIHDNVPISKISSLDFSEGCNICLEPFTVDDTVLHSMDTDNCRHLFHEQCILSWLVSRPDPLCPCCRQSFAVLEDETPRTSLCSQEEFSRAFGPRAHDTEPAETTVSSAL